MIFPLYFQEVAQLFRAALSPKHGFHHSFVRAVFAVPDEKMCRGKRWLKTWFNVGYFYNIL
jgi:hypothetical protein